MFCNKCWESNTSVIETRTWDDAKSTRRRRLCNNCWNRFTTYEKIEVVSMIVEKNGNKKERYNREKLERSILKAIDKRSISVGKVKEILSQLEYDFSWTASITSKQIGSQTLEKLREVDEVAFIRYASIYKQFEKADDFIEFIQKNLEK